MLDSVQKLFVVFNIAALTHSEVFWSNKHDPSSAEEPPGYLLAYSR